MRVQGWDFPVFCKGFQLIRFSGHFGTLGYQVRTMALHLLGDLNPKPGLREGLEGSGPPQSNNGLDVRSVIIRIGLWGIFYHN